MEEEAREAIDTNNDGERERDERETERQRTRAVWMICMP